MKLLNFFLVIIFCNNLFSQETFPVNGVVENYKPIYAFVNGKLLPEQDLILKMEYY